MEASTYAYFKGLLGLDLGSKFQAFRGQSWRRGTKCDCKTDWSWVRSPLEEMKYLFPFIFSFLRSGV